ncbi:MAG: rhodanese-like domain-containing protein [Rhodospirillales bacterium]|nr:rhodanese-like domain-containing protein [Rhodospirillales bacterium]
MQFVKEANAVDVGQWLEDSDTVLIDVREDSELQFARVPNAIHHPLSQFNVAAMEKEKDKRVVFICAHGVRSYQIGQHLLDNGILKEAYSLTGGLQAWAAAGMPVDTSPQAA